MSLKDFEKKHWTEKTLGIQFRHQAALQLADGSTLDVGCGDGLFMCLLRDKGLPVQGIDISEAGIEKCKLKRLDAIVGDITKPLPYSDKQFDCAVALDVLEHVYFPGDIVRELRRVSHSAIISVPNFSSLPARLQVLLGGVPENNGPSYGHLQWFNWYVLKNVVESNGFTISEVRMNAPWGFTFLARLWPNLFALSFVVKCT